MKKVLTCEKCGTSIEVSSGFSEAMIEIFKQEFQKNHACEPRQLITQNEVKMSKEKDNGTKEQQLGLPLKPEEIKRLQQDLVRNILIVKNLSDEITEKKKSYNEVIKDKKKEIDSIAQTLKEQGGFGSDLEAALNGIHHQMAVAGELEV